MKTQISLKPFIAIFGVVAWTISAMPLIAQNSTPVTSAQTAPALSYGAANVLKLAQAGVGEETIVAYVEKSGQGYSSLGASEIIYLRDQGISDRVLTAMLTQEKNTRDLAAASAVQQQNAIAATQTVPQTAPVASAPQYQQTYTPPAVTYVQTTPAPLIVMHDSSPRLIDYGIYPRYGYGCYPSYGYRSYGYSYPRVSFSVGFGGHHSGFGFRGGGFRGGFCR